MTLLSGSSLPIPKQARNIAAEDIDNKFGYAVEGLVLAYASWLVGTGEPAGVLKAAKELRKTTIRYGDRRAMEAQEEAWSLCEKKTHS